MVEVRKNDRLTLKHIRHVYGQGDQALTVLEDVSLGIAAGEIVGLIGSSGSGKSTLLQIAGLLDIPTAGEVVVEGESLSKASDTKRTLVRREKLGFIYQFHHLLPEFSAWENVAMHAAISGTNQKHAKEQAHAMLREVGLEERATHRPGELSGGEKQRVAIARALVHQPQLILADEPTGNLDERNASNVFEVMVELAEKRGMAALVATHDLELAKKLPHCYRLHDGTLEKA